MTSHIQTISHRFSSGDPETDAVLDDYTWTGTTGSAATISYSFNANPLSSGYFDSADQQAARQALAAWANLANITFNEVSSGGDILFTRYNFTDPSQGGEAFVTFSGTRILDVEVRITPNTPSLSYGTEGYYILLHEIGHALGLKHTGNYSGSDDGPFLPAAEDNTTSSVLSYNVSLGVYPATPMIYDVSAIGFLYGARSSINSGDSFYAADGSSAVAQTLVDTGGTDTLSASAVSFGVRLDLRSGTAYSTQIGSQYLFIAENTTIENAQGSSGGDEIYGNNANNALFGNAGSDILRGADGQDTIYGGIGAVDTTDLADTIYGGHGSDHLYGNAGNDTIYCGTGEGDPNDGSDLAYGGKGADLIYGNAGDDSIYGGGNGYDPSDEADTIYGGKGSDTIYGNGSNDIIYGGGGGADPDDTGDLIYGGAGDDYILGNGGVDSIYGHAGNDTMHGGVGDDLYYYDQYSSGTDTILQFEGAGDTSGDLLMILSGINGTGIASASDVLSRISYSGGVATVDLGTDLSILIEGLGSTTLNSFDIVIT